MELMTGYGSDSDDESPATIPVPAPAVVKLSTVADNRAKLQKTSHQPAFSNQSAGPVTKKLNINILPPEIQFALRHGGTLSDSDDEEGAKESKITKKVQPPSNSSIPPESVKVIPQDKSRSMTGLMALLPKPVEQLKEPTYQKPTAAASTASKPNFSFHSTTTTIEKVSNLSVPGVDIAESSAKVSYQDIVNKFETNMGVNSYSDSDEDEESGTLTLNPTPLFTFQTSAHANPSSSSSSNSSSRTDPTVSDSGDLYGPSRPAVGTIQPEEAPSVYNNSAEHYHYDPSTIYSAESDYNHNDSSVPLDNNQRRKRERELEQALRSGDLSALESLGNIGVVQSTVPDRWDTDAYKGELETEIKISKLANSVGLKHGISKSQNRKHQINTLAVQAAKMELQLLEAKGVRNQTKYQTQQKYGW